VDIYEKIDEIGQYVEQAKIVPVLKQKMVDASYLMKMLEELYASMMNMKRLKKSLKHYLQRLKLNVKN
jgi:hypothetical protein